MKLATLNDGSRDGQLVVVSRDLSSAHYATGIADHLQQALDDWNFISPQLQDLSDVLNHGKPRHAFAFDARQCMAPLPRAYLLATGPGYASTPAAMPMTLLPAHELGGPCAPMRAANDKQLLDFEAALAVVTGDVPQGATPAQALDTVRLLMLLNHSHCRALQPRGVLPHTFCAPVAVTPDELTALATQAWAQGRVGLALTSRVNGRSLGTVDTASGMTRHFGELVASLCLTQRLRAGSIVSSGAVRPTAQPTAPADLNRPQGLAHGDVVQIDALLPNGQSVFGGLSHEVLLENA